MPRAILVLTILTVGLSGCSGPHYNPDDQPLKGLDTQPATAAAAERPPAAKASTRRSQVETPWVPVAEWTRTNNLPPPRQVSAGERPVFEIRSSLGSFAFQIGTRHARYDGMSLLLGFVPSVFGGQPCLHHLDLQQNVSPLLLSEAGWLDDPGIVVVDPGHGGRNTGTRSAEDRLEKHYTLDWALRLRPLLEAEGWTVHLTRTNDVELTLSNRVAFATACGADLFLSLHFNASGEGAYQSGLETYCLTPAGMPSNLTRGYEDDLTVTHPNNAFDVENLQLAVRVHRALLGVNGGDDRGVRRARFMSVLRRQHCPAVLVEGGFLSNPREASRIADPAYRQQLAVAVAQALHVDKTHHE